MALWRDHPWESETACESPRTATLPRSLYLQVFYHAPSSSLVPHCPRICPPPVLPCGKFLEARPASKFPSGGASWWSSRVKPHLPAPSCLWSGTSSILCYPSLCSSAPHTPPLSWVWLRPQIQANLSQSCFKKAAKELSALSASSSCLGCCILHSSSSCEWVSTPGCFSLCSAPAGWPKPRIASS